eukprot:7034048-Prymnesium_polylepis.1
MEREREARSKMEQEWKARGMARFTENKDQTAVSRRARESLEKRNHLRGTHVKDEKQQWKQQAKTEVDAFMEKSQQQCKDFGSDLKRKIAETKKNLTERNRQVPTRRRRPFWRACANGFGAGQRSAALFASTSAFARFVSAALQRRQGRAQGLPGHPRRPAAAVPR